LIEDISLVTRAAFQDAGDSIVLVETVNRQVGKVDLEEERAIHNFISMAIRDRLVKSAHDLSEGGFAVALAECCYSNFHRGAVGAELGVPSHLELVRDLFGEFTTRVILSTTSPVELCRRAELAGLKSYELGKVGGNRLILNYEGERVVDIAIDELESAWRQGLPKLLS
jgi:phosphoribosylformylglycinamidine synthase subunit PurL